MDCNQNRLNCTPDQIFAAISPEACGKIADPSTFSGEQLIYSQAYKDLIKSRGIEVDYYVHTYNLSGANNLYGEQPTSIFYGPIPVMMYVEINNEAVTLSKFGFDAADEFTGFVHIETFANTLSAKDFFVKTSAGDILHQDLAGSLDYTQLDKHLENTQALEPKSGDIIDVKPLGCDRPNGRTSNIYQITERMDQDISTLNPLLGHYVFRLRAKRFEYSFEPNAPQEGRNDQVFENSFSGTVSSNIPGVEVSDDKVYEEDIDDISRNDVYDMDATDNDIYGDYY